MPRLHALVIGPADRTYRDFGERLAACQSAGHERKTDSLIDHDKTMRGDRIFLVTIGLVFLLSAAAKTEMGRSMPCPVAALPLGPAGNVLEGGESLG